MKTTRHERLVEGGCVPKHMVHIRHIGHVPIIERLVKGVCAEKQTRHIRHIIGHVPIANLAVFVQNSLLPSPAVVGSDIILYCKANTLIRHQLRSNKSQAARSDWSRALNGAWRQRAPAATAAAPAA